MPKKPERGLIPLEIIERRIYLIRGQKVMFDFDLAALYQAPTKALNQAVRRNLARFPDDFMFQLTARELAYWKSQIVTSNPAAKMGLRKSPLVFTEHGVAMLSSVLQSDRAVQVNIAIVRTFARLRQILATHKELGERLTAMEKKYDQQFKVVFDILAQLMEPPEPAKHPIGFVGPGKKLLVKPKRVVDPDDVLTPAEAKRLRRSLKQTHQGKARPWADIRHELGLQEDLRGRLRDPRNSPVTHGRRRSGSTDSPAP
jgi:hypothetical protein